MWQMHSNKHWFCFSVCKMQQKWTSHQLRRISRCVIVYESMYCKISCQVRLIRKSQLVAIASCITVHKLWQEGPGFWATEEPHEEMWKTLQVRRLWCCQENKTETWNAPGERASVIVSTPKGFRQLSLFVFDSLSDRDIMTSSVNSTKHT